MSHSPTAMQCRVCRCRGYARHLVVIGMATFEIVVAKLVRNVHRSSLVCVALAATNQLSIFVGIRPATRVFNVE